MSENLANYVWMQCVQGGPSCKGPIQLFDRLLLIYFGYEIVGGHGEGYAVALRNFGKTLGNSVILL